jgi:hypothetical protein
MRAAVLSTLVPLLFAALGVERADRASITMLPVLITTSMAPSIPPIAASTRMVSHTHDIIGGRQCEGPSRARRVETRVASGGETEARPLIIIDGERRPFDSVSHLEPERIDRLVVLRAPEAVKRFGAAARDGALLIITKGPPA